jgi:uncharacterized protein YkwD
MHPSPAPRRRLAIAMRAALIAAFAITVFAPTATATSVSSAESSIIGWVNAARSARGLVPLRYDGDLAAISGLRASRMAAANSMSHTVGGNLASQLNASGLIWYRYGENIGWSTATWPATSGRSIFLAWMNSPAHKALILSDRFNYIGVGLAYRSSNHKTFASAVFAETTDHTRAVARVTGASRSGDDVRWTWSGYDPRLQTHTAGLRNFDVQYRINSGTWVLLRNDTTATSLSLANRPHGRYYSIRVRATDRRGNVGVWSSERRIWVP